MRARDQTRGPVPLREAIESVAFREARRKSRLVIPLGKGTDDDVEVLDLSQAQNLLIAGAVLSGKTEFINSMVACLALCNKPDQLQLLLIDITKVELTSFSCLAHLAMPVVTNIDQAVDAFHWLRRETNTRYQKLASVRASNIESYNRSDKVGKPMPYLVVIIYELSDLMLGKQDMVEPLCCDLAGLSPKAGIHLVIATQRPARSVITDAIKTSFPTRICFATASVADSRVVLDMPGTEKLRKHGDMLYLTPGASQPKRLRGCSISDEEIYRLVSCVNPESKMDS